MATTRPDETPSPETHPLPTRPGLAAVALRGLALAACTGVVATLLFVVGSDLVPRESPRSFAQAFLHWGLAYYLLLVFPAPMFAWALGRGLGRRGPGLARVAVVLVAALVAFGALVSNRSVLPAFFALEGPWGYRYLTPLAFLAGLTGVLAGGLMPLAKRALPVGLALLAVLLTAAAFRPAALRPVGPGSARGASASGAARPTPLVFVGVDGADWKLMRPLLERGELPTLAGLRARGAFGDLATIKPTLSPALWTTMVTGRSPKKHGIEGFTSLRVAGVAGALGRTRPPTGLLFERFYRHLVDSERIREGPVVSSARRVPAFWEIASAHGSPLSVVSLWATWPAEPVLGALVSERIYYHRQAARAGDPAEHDRLTWPEELFEEVRPLVMDPQSVSFEEARTFVDVTPEEFQAMRQVSVHAKSVEGELKYLYSMFETERRTALHLVERSRREAGQPFDLLVLFRIVDIACHRALDASELVEDHLGATAEQQRKFGRLVSEAYRRVDRALAEILAGYPEANIVVVSDHGFGRESQKGVPVYQHYRAPPGVFLAAGPAIRPGPVAGFGILDVLPLLAALKGLPIADDLEGRLREDLLQPDFLARSPVRRIATYGKRGAIAVARDVAEADEEMLERLRALGYVK